MTTSEGTHYNQARKRKAEFIRPNNTLKAKVGSGGLSDDILDKAQALLENHSADFLPLAEIYLGSLIKGIEKAQDPQFDGQDEHVISLMLYPTMQLKANGGMFHYTLITIIADKLIQFLEVIEKADLDAIEIVLAFHTTMRAIILGKITGDGGSHGKELIGALDEACTRYFDQFPKVKSRLDDYSKGKF
jgi:hypothetical protein